MSKLPSGVVAIRGREYQTVALRVSNFRAAHSSLSLVTEILYRDVDCVVMRATISDETGRVLATGHAEEYRKASEINKTSALENCETSAIGRALASFGLGGTEFASADEVARAVSGAKGEPNLSHSPTKIMFDAIQPERQDFLRRVAQQVTGAMPDCDKAMDILEMAELEGPEEKAGLWHLLDSATRSGIKRAAEKAGAPRQPNE